MYRFRRTMIAAALSAGIFVAGSPALAAVWVPLPKPAGVTGFYSVAALQGALVAAACFTGNPRNCIGSGGLWYASSSSSWAWINLGSGTAHVALELAADSSSHVYMLDKNDRHPYRWGGGTRFVTVAGPGGNLPGSGDLHCPQPNDIAVAGDRFYVGPCRDGGIFSTNATTDNWGEVGLPLGYSGPMRAVGGTFLSGARVIDNAGATWAYDGQAYSALGRPDVPFQLHSHAITRFGGATLAIGSGSSPFGDGPILLYSSTTWVPVGGSAYNISASADTVAVVTYSGDVLRLQP
jgi:hypothetical protein